MTTPNSKPKVVVLCGSTRFTWLYEDAAIQESAAGNIVLTANINFKNRYHCDLLLDQGHNIEDVKVKVDHLHFRKIDLADEVIILNEGGYIGDSTRNEITYAEAKGKKIRYWEDTRVHHSTIHPDSAVRKAQFKNPGKGITDIIWDGS